MRKTSVSIHIITLYISMIRPEENSKRLTVVEEIIWRRERGRERGSRTHARDYTHSHTHTHTHTHMHTHTHARTHARTHAHTHTHTLDRKGW